jgi:PAS domain S-box-containing protein
MNSNATQSNDDSNEENRFQTLVAAISDYAIYMLDTGGHVISWNAGAQRFKGYVADEIIGEHFSRFYTEEERNAGTPSQALRIADQEGKYEAEGWRVRKDGTRFWASVVIDPIRKDNGDLVGFAKITRDITERAMAAEVLRQSEQQFRLLVQGVTDYAIYMLDVSGFVTNWNSGAQHIKGFRAEEVIGTHFSRFYIPEEQDARMPDKALAIATQQGRYEHEGWRVRKDGSRFFAHVIIDAIRDELGQLVGFAKVTRDITEKRATAEALKKANEALFQSQKMEALGQLTGGVAHDFNNLLGVISSGIDMLQLQMRGDSKTLDSMRRAVDRGAELTQHLLSFARQQPLQAKISNLNELISGFESVLRRAGNSTIRFDIQLQKELCPAMIDATLFQTTLLNLVVNARDAMPDGGHLTISTQNVQLADQEIGALPAGTYARICVSDTGTGMPPNVVARVFEPFFTTKEVGKGTGLGLSQVYGFIMQSGGNITVASQLGEGTQIAMYLPAAEGDTVPYTASRDNVEKVLIVEDDADLLDVAAELFRAIGYTVHTAGSARDALNVMEKNSDIDILFSDVMMPNGMSGVELARLTRDRYPGIKIILTSGYAMPALKSEHKDLDNFLFINKPYQLSDVAKKLRQVG